jgi:predicted nucleic acid-binding protein
VIYLDASAIVKLIVEETETPALMSYLEVHREATSSVLTEVEVERALRRAVAVPATLVARGHAVLARIPMVTLDAQVLRLAAQIGPPSLRTLDALHLATAMSLGLDLTALVSYDQRLLDAAAAHGVRVAAPR